MLMSLGCYLLTAVAPQINVSLKVFREKLTATSKSTDTRGWREREKRESVCEGRYGDISPEPYGRGDGVRLV
ncbi:hypothetical protein KUCAC02_029513 [Chaenocephalus aceratus]|nr:hypothetical protein KUCAC02_035009 [Chaenocephalus aceratus]KAI4795994.1 hypothetical protein KUCAC02_029513 [Chaenocephalus aceratus]